MKKFFVTICCVFLLSSFHVSAQTISEDALKKNVFYLASDSLEGRQTGSTGEWLASKYIISIYKSLGLEPMGENNSYLQPFETNVGVSYTNSEENYLSVDRALLKPEVDYYPLNFSSSAIVTGNLYSVGYGIEETKIEHTDFIQMSGDTNQILLIQTSSPEGDNPHSKFYPYQDLQIKIQNAIRHGAKAVIFINTRDDAEDAKKNFQKYVSPVSIPVVFVKRESYEKYFTGKTKRVTMSVGLKKNTVIGHNVIAFKNNHAKTTIVIGAHYDHLGFDEYGGSLYRGDSVLIHNGADDNASGTAGVLQLATVLSKQNSTANNFLFINFSGEELGLIGSKYFTEHSTIDTSTINCMLNMDMIGRYNPDKGMEISGAGTSPQFSFLDSMKQDGLKWKLSKSGTGPTDHTSFYHINVPVLNFFTGTHADYHKPTDDADKLDYKKEAEILSLELRILDSISKKGTLTFTRTKEDSASSRTEFKVRLGIIPDYMYEGVGLRVDGVNEGQTADKAGIQKGDVIIKIGDFTISDITAYMKSLGAFIKGDTTDIVVKRGEEEKTLKATF